jgi:hypothetical protein
VENQALETDSPSGAAQRRVIYSYIKAPAIPGIYEILIQVFIVLFIGAIGATLGLVVDIVVGFFKKLKR